MVAAAAVAACGGDGHARACASCWSIRVVRRRRRACGGRASGAGIQRQQPKSSSVCAAVATVDTIAVVAIAAIAAIGAAIAEAADVCFLFFMIGFQVGHEKI